MILDAEALNELDRQVDLVAASGASGKRLLRCVDFDPGQWDRCSLSVYGCYGVLLHPVISHVSGGIIARRGLVLALLRAFAGALSFAALIFQSIEVDVAPVCADDNDTLSELV